MWYPMLLPVEPDYSVFHITGMTGARDLVTATKNNETPQIIMPYAEFYITAMPCRAQQIMKLNSLRRLGAGIARSGLNGGGQHGR